MLFLSDTENKTITKPQIPVHFTNNETHKTLENRTNPTSEELIEEAKKEILELLLIELRSNNEAMNQKPYTSNTQTQETNISPEEQHEKYQKIKESIQILAYDKSLTFENLTTHHGIKTLPEELKNKLMGEIAMMINNKEIDPEIFFHKLNTQIQ